MNFLEAVQSDKQFRRAGWTEWFILYELGLNEVYNKSIPSAALCLYSVDSEIAVPLTATEIRHTDWEVRAARVTLTEADIRNRLESSITDTTLTVIVDLLMRGTT